MKQLYLLILIVLVWTFSTVNTSGWGATHNTELFTQTVLVLWFLITINKSKSKIRLGGRNSRLSFFTFLSFIFFPFVLHGSLEGATYLMMILLVYCFSQCTINPRILNISSYIIAGLGILTLLAFSRLDVLSGWNENQIAMIGLFSYMYYVISMSGQMSFKKISIGAVISVIYALLLIPTNSRSAVLFVAIAIFLIYTNAAIKLINSKKKLRWLLSVPLFIAVLVVLFPNFSLFDYIKEISTNNYGKQTAFNGRDEIWRDAFLNMPKTFFLGTGEFKINHHNSAMAVLDIFGIIGYICWIKLINKPLETMRGYINDNIVYGSMVSFFVIFWQQSLELGFVTPFPNMIPYMILGIGVGRVNTLRKCNLK